MILERFPELAALPKSELMQLAREILDEHFTFGDEEIDQQIGECEPKSGAPSIHID